MRENVDKWRAYVGAYRANPRDYTAQDGYFVEALEELLAEIDELEESLDNTLEVAQYLDENG